MLPPQPIKILDLFDQDQEIGFLQPDVPGAMVSSNYASPLMQPAYDTFHSLSTTVGINYLDYNGQLKPAYQSLVDESSSLILYALNLEHYANEWAVIYFPTSAIAHSFASTAIGYYLSQEPKKSQVVYGVHPLSTNSVHQIGAKTGNSFGYPLVDCNSKGKLCWLKDEVHEQFKNWHKVLFIPGIEELTGLGVYEFYNMSHTNHKFQGMPKVYDHVILDATNSATKFFSPEQRTERNLNSCSAIVFEGASFHSFDLGVLLIRKKYLSRGLPAYFNDRGTLMWDITVTGIGEYGSTEIGSSQFSYCNVNPLYIVSFAANIAFVHATATKLFSEMYGYTNQLNSFVQRELSPDISLFRVGKEYKIKESSSGVNNILSLHVADAQKAEKLAFMLQNALITVKNGYQGNTIALQRHIYDGTVASVNKSIIRLTLGWHIGPEEVQRIMNVLIDSKNELFDSEQIFI